MSHARYIIGDVFDVLATLPDDSVDLVFSSPPFLALRSYLPADHELKAKEIGSEATPADFLDTLLDVVEACDRVLAPHGSLCFELGDTFAGSGGRGEASLNAWNDRGYQGASNAKPGTNARAQAGDGWPMDKSLCLLSTLFPACLAYGRNLLRPERETPRWRIRNLVVWARPNPPVGALGDKFRPATSYLTVATKARDRYFDLDAVRTEHLPHSQKYGDAETRARNSNDSYIVPERGDGGRMTYGLNPAGAPPLDYWVIPTAPYKGSHYATFPPELVVKPVKAMCPAKVCRVCGEPSRRITEATYEALRQSYPDGTREVDGYTWRGNLERGKNSTPDKVPAAKHVDTVDWTDCGCCARQMYADMGVTGVPLEPGDITLSTCVDPSHWRAGVTLDPFAGSGTTLAVATGHGRDAIGIDIDSRNADLALERVGPMFLEIEHLNAEGAA